MNLTQSFYRILPEVILTVTGVVVMLIEATLLPAGSRKPLGCLAIVGVLSGALRQCSAVVCSLPELPTAASCRPMLSASSSTC